ncbi:hypothetical protein V6N11_038975 [Hibiscus sabdariffa]|uniref:Uncharacterized protein n=1 Tax=Hibiscus sabdariffa TaxID=183260 RepID=A0ABR2SLV4_9ROSI
MANPPAFESIIRHYPAALASHEEIMENPVKFHACLKVLKFFEFYKWVTLRGGFKEVDQHNRWPELDQNEENFEIQSPLSPPQDPKTSTFSKTMLLKYARIDDLEIRTIVQCRIRELMDDGYLVKARIDGLEYDGVLNLFRV